MIAGIGARRPGVGANRIELEIAAGGIVSLPSLVVEGADDWEYFPVAILPPKSCSS